MEQVESSEILTHIKLSVFDISAKNTQWGKIVSSTNVARKSRYLHAC